MELIIWIVVLTFLVMIIKDFLTFVSIRQQVEPVSEEPQGKKILLVKLEEVPYKDMLVYLLYTADKQKFLGQDLDKQRLFETVFSEHPSKEEICVVEANALGNVFVIKDSISRFSTK